MADRPLIHSNQSVLKNRLSTRNLYELQVKATSYEAMIQRFQLRKVSGVGNRLSGATIDKVFLSEKVETTRQRPSVRRVVLGLKNAVTQPITPGSWAAFVHKLLMLVINHFQLIYLPFLCAYCPDGSVGTVCVGAVLQCLYLMDLLANLNTAYVRKQKLVTSRRKIAQNHITKWFILELVSALPVTGVLNLSSGTWGHYRSVLVQ